LIDQGVVLKRKCLLAAMVLVLTGCDLSDEEEAPSVYRISSIDVSDGAGLQTGRIRYDYSGSGFLQRIVNFTAAGADSAWGSADDVIGYWSQCSFTGTSSVSFRDLSVEYGLPPLAAAALGEWTTNAPKSPQCADGLVGFSSGTERVHVADGGDAWLTANDVQDSYAYNLMLNTTNQSIWTWESVATPSTTRQRTFTYNTNPSGGLTSINVIETTGTTTPTVDFTGRYLYTFDGSGRLSVRRLIDAGPDGVRGNADDVEVSRIELTRSGSSTTVIGKDALGAKVSEYVYVITDGKLDTETYRYPGGDGDFDTSDDEFVVHKFNYQKL
ncbi:MAG: hypothetical protein Q8J78_02710, partial [Moraxellaceae bacterium]|nr:hypothetical protein [Moraxellaceae bacterium]